MISLVVNGFTAKCAFVVTRLVQEIQSQFTFETHAEEISFLGLFLAKSWLIFNIPCTYTLGQGFHRSYSCSPCHLLLRRPCQGPCSCTFWTKLHVWLSPCMCWYTTCVESVPLHFVRKDFALDPGALWVPTHTHIHPSYRLHPIFLPGCIQATQQGGKTQELATIQEILLCFAWEWFKRRWES